MSNISIKMLNLMLGMFEIFPASYQPMMQSVEIENRETL